MLLTTSNASAYRHSPLFCRPSAATAFSLSLSLSSIFTSIASNERLNGISIIVSVAYENCQQTIKATSVET